MDFDAEKFVDNLLTEEALGTPSDSIKHDELVLELPEGFNEKKYNQGRRFYYDNSFALSSTMLMGLVAVLAVPSILRVLTGSRRSNGVYTAYKRYLSTLLHTISWFEHELKPGSVSWKSLHTVRSRHLRAGLSGKLKGIGTVSQRDVSLTLFGFVGYSILKPDWFGIRQIEKGDWDAYVYFWRIIGQMIGLQDRYNICKSFEETHEVCGVLNERVFKPCLENVPEYFEHMARMILDGFSCVNPTIEIDGFLYFVRALSDVPGYVYYEKDRLKLQREIKKHLKGSSLDTGVDSMKLMRAPGLDGLPKSAPRLLYYNDYNSVEEAPAYKRLTVKARYKLFMVNLYARVISSYLGRLYFNLTFRFSVFLMRNFPYLAFFRFGIKNSYVSLSEEAPTDDTVPKKNEEYIKPYQPEPWYKVVWSLLW